MSTISREYTDRFEAIVAIAADAIISIDQEQRILLFNEGAEEIFGYTQGEIAGRSLPVLSRRDSGKRTGLRPRPVSESSVRARRMGQRREIFQLPRTDQKLPLRRRYRRSMSTENLYSRSCSAMSPIASDLRRRRRSFWLLKPKHACRRNDRRGCAMKCSALYHTISAIHWV